MVISIPKELVKKGELVLLPRSEYEEFLQWRKSIKMFRPTAVEKKALSEARKDFKQGNYLTFEEFKNELANSYSS